MAIPVVCSCGKRFDLKTEFAGRQVACPSCGAAISVPAVRGQADPAFDRDRFLLRLTPMLLRCRCAPIFDLISAGIRSCINW